MEDSSDLSAEIEARLNQLHSPPPTIADETTMDLEAQWNLLKNDPAVKQCLIRREEDGVDTLSALLCCDLLPDQHRYVLHLPIYPPMTGRPEVEVHLSDDTVRAKTTDRQPYGIRIELTTGTAPTTASAVHVELIIVSG